MQLPTGFHTILLLMVVTKEHPFFLIATETIPWRTLPWSTLIAALLLSLGKYQDNLISIQVASKYVIYCQALYLTMFGTDRALKDHLCCHLGATFTSFNRLGRVSKFLDFCQASPIEKLEYVDEISAEKNTPVPNQVKLCNRAS